MSVKAFETWHMRLILHFYHKVQIFSHISMFQMRKSKITRCPNATNTGIFSAILGRGPRAFLIGKISDIHPEFGKFSKHSKLMIFSNLT